LRSLGVEFEVVSPDIDESQLADEPPVEYVERLAREKCAITVERMGSRASTVAVLAADTTVELDGEVLGKTESDAEASVMLRRLSGRTHHVHTGVALWRSPEIVSQVVTTDVTFVELSDDDIAWYVATGEPHDKAGSYGIQGAAGAFVKSITGAPSNVAGLPLAETRAMLRAAGVC
jgi:septum formation protein